MQIKNRYWLSERKKLVGTKKHELSMLTNYNKLIYFGKNIYIQNKIDQRNKKQEGSFVLYIIC